MRKIIETVPLVRDDGTREYVQATPDVVTPPAVGGKSSGEHAFTVTEEQLDAAFREINSMLDRWTREPVRCPWTGPVPAMAADWSSPRPEIQFLPFAQQCKVAK